MDGQEDHLATAITSRRRPLRAGPSDGNRQRHRHLEMAAYSGSKVVDQQPASNTAEILKGILTDCDEVVRRLAVDDFAIGLV